MVELCTAGRTVLNHVTQSHMVLSLKEFRVGRIAFSVLFFASVFYFSRRNRAEQVSIGFTVSICPNVLLI